ncbi:Coenzyme F420 hydrogenase/dehydrogenase, beta subunit C-terminal domain [Candidatus Bathyarchaeota archaeon]|nr:Coenzyme F420 hydrogenase/dehydrogenase, beta subunit C-terminal domain [Candidatus Bathyarchaeota archaeon]
MQFQKISFEESLGKFVIKPRICVGCGSCVAVCPFNCLEYAANGPKIINECKSCGICAQICPRFNFSMQLSERFVFGRERAANEEFGIYKSIVIAQTTNDDVMKVCQDGGVVTSLLLFALENGLVNGAVTSGESSNEPLKAVPKLALYRDEALHYAGTRYTYSPNMLALRDAVLKKIGKVIFVGTPCQIHAVRKIQMLPLKKYADVLGVSIGLFCSESFTYEGLVNKFLQEKMHITPSEISRMNIKGKLILKMRNGGVKTASLKDIKEYACGFCATCPDFSAELADISAGGLGLEGWTLTIIRTERGEELFKKAEAAGAIRVRAVESEKDKVIELLTRMSKRKRENAIKAYQSRV